MQDNIFVDETNGYKFESIGEQLFLNGEIMQLDIEKIDDETFHVIFKQRTYLVEVVSKNKEGKTIELNINGRPHQVKMVDAFDYLLSSMGMGQSNKNGVSVLKAPMPGMVLDILVQVGDAVAKGSNLLVLEAMKMENIIKSPAEVVIKTVEIQKGASVEKNQVLLTFEESF